MTEVVSGWGVWLETIEITDVKILSGTLFKDMQCTFREDQNKTATLQKLEVDQEIRIQKENHELQTKKRAEETRKTKRLEESSRGIKNKQQEVEATKKSIAIQKKETERKWESWLEGRKLEQKKKLEQIINDNEKYKKARENEVIQEEKRRDIVTEEEATSMAEVKKQVERESLQEAQNRSMKQAEYDLTKEKMQDPVFVQNMRQEMIASVYASASGTWNVRNLDGKDALVHLIDGLVEAQLNVKAE